MQRLPAGWRATSLGNPALGPYPQCWQSLPRKPWDLAPVAGHLCRHQPAAGAGPGAAPLLESGSEAMDADLNTWLAPSQG